MAGENGGAAAVESMDEGQYLEKTFGLKTVEEIKAAIEKKPDGDSELTNKLTAATQRVTSLETEIGTVKQENENLKKTPPMQPYKKDVSKFVDNLPDNFTPEQISEAIRLNGIDVDKLTPEQSIKLAAKFQNPGWQDEHADADFNSKYTYDPADQNVTEQQKKLKEAEMISASAKSREWLKTHIAQKFEVKPNANAEQMKKRQEQLTEFWSAKSPVIIKDLAKISGKTMLKLPGAKGAVEEIEVPYEYNIPEKDLSELSQNMTQTAVRGLIDNTQDGEKLARQIAQSVIKDKYSDQKDEALILSAQNKFIEFLKREFNVEVAAGAAGGGGGGGGTKKTSFERSVLDNEKKQRTRR